VKNKVKSFEIYCCKLEKISFIKKSNHNRILGVYINMDEDRVKNEKENAKNIALNFLAELLAKIPEEICSTHKIGFGSRILTIKQLVSEVNNDTDEGKLIVKAINKYGFEMIKGEDKK
jgi:hypothetical protein